MRLVFASLILMMSASSDASGSLFPRPKPEAYAHKEDRELARLADTPCSQADEGKGCIRAHNRLTRKRPCAYDDGKVVIHRRTDKCFKMDKPRRFRGVWINEFEGQRFVAENATAPEWPHSDPRSPGWKEQFEKARSASIWLSIDRQKIAPLTVSSEKMLIEFVGRKTRFLGSYGHMGLSGHEIVVDRVISLVNLEK